MAYLVSLALRAERDLARLYDQINAEPALKWYRGLKKAILTLEQRPNRCPVSNGNARLRHLLFGSQPHVCRVIFRIREKQEIVEVLHIRHGAMRRTRKG